ncbi:4-hydroxy-3-methylbut-2-enyl diphosphate reductase [Odoribacter sp. OttesenSCG-928-J03]|nr:4-hydroxy-3-methylbut-2-enyl diphosphate reductase [Odoribacter sp. OttesenSCG-928-J03]
MFIEIDHKSGFCTGVVNAIKMAEEELEKGVLYCIGDIVHNNLEVDRLNKKGLITIDHEHFAALKNCRVLFRAHGEPPESYRMAEKNKIEIIDASCPVVLYLQRQIREAYVKVKECGGRIVIYGKKGHAEVVGLVGQTNGEALVIEDENDIDQIDFTRPVILFSQTTKNLDSFQAISDVIRKRGGELVTVHDTICRKVANRIPELKAFAAKHDVILFVSGEKSSNGKQLYSICKDVNENTYFVHGVDDIYPEMFLHAQSVGISGATSTPLWIMEEIRDRLSEENKK